MAQVIDFARDDAEMNAAIANPRATPPGFPEKSTSMPKKAWFPKAAPPMERRDIPHEHIWMALCAPAGSEAFGCVVNNWPERAGPRPGRRNVFGSEIATDWMYLDRNRMIHGAHTTRVTPSRMPAGQAGGPADQMPSLDTD